MKKKELIRMMGQSDGGEVAVLTPEGQVLNVCGASLVDNVSGRLRGHDVSHVLLAAPRRPEVPPHKVESDDAVRMWEVFHGNHVVEFTLRRGRPAFTYDSDIIMSWRAVPRSDDDGLVTSYAGSVHLRHARALLHAIGPSDFGIVQVVWAEWAKVRLAGEVVMRSATVKYVACDDGTYEAHDTDDPDAEEPLAKLPNVAALRAHARVVGHVGDGNEGPFEDFVIREEGVGGPGRSRRRAGGPDVRRDHQPGPLVPHRHQPVAVPPQPTRRNFRPGGTRCERAS
jgi:hypothetical protein